MTGVQTCALPISKGSILAAMQNNFTVSIEYKDALGNEYSGEEKILLKLGVVTSWQKTVLFIKKTFRDMAEGF